MIRTMRSTHTSSMPATLREQQDEDDDQDDCTDADVHDLTSPQSL